MRHAFVEGKNSPLLHKWAKPNTWIKQADPNLNIRFERLAYLRNIILDEALKDEDYVLWIDSDIVDFPANLIRDLMKHNMTLVAPSVWIEGTSQFYDTLAFRDIYEQNVPAFHLPYKGLVEMGSIGACYLAASKVYTKMNLRYRGGDSEHAMFCQDLRKTGEKVYADFDIIIRHANLPQYGGKWH